MAATVVQNLEAAQNTGLATVTVSHSSTTANNLLLLVVGADDYRTTAGSGRPESTGYALVTGGAQETFLGHYVWYKVAAGGETSVQYTIGSASPSCWEFYEVSGLTSTPFDISNGQLAGSAGNTYTTPAITPTTGDRWLFASMGGSLNSALTGMGTWLNSFVELNDTFTTLGSGTRDVIGAAALSVTANGSTAYSSGATYDATSPQSRTGIIAAFKVAGGGTAFTRTVDDPAGLVDAVTVVSAFVRTVDDTDGLTDPAAAASAFARTQTDDAGQTDAATAASAFARSATDDAGLTDSATTQLFSGFTRTVDDPAGLTDTRAVSQAATVSDSAGLGDSRALAQTATVTDSTGPADSTSAQLAGTGSRQVDDTAGLTDAVTYSSTQMFTDSLGLVDAATLAMAAARAATDVLGLIDTVVVALARSVTVTDTAGLTDSVTADLSTGGAHTRTITDTIGLDSTHRVLQTTYRVNTGTTARAAGGTTTRPSQGTTSRYPLVPD